MNMGCVHFSVDQEGWHFEPFHNLKKKKKGIEMRPLECEINDFQRDGSGWHTYFYFKDKVGSIFYSLWNKKDQKQQCICLEIL